VKTRIVASIVSYIISIFYLFSRFSFGQGSLNPTTNFIGDRRSPEKFGVNENLEKNEWKLK
jgi:hypothetical protein